MGTRVLLLVFFAAVILSAIMLWGGPQELETEVGATSHGVTEEGRMSDPVSTAGGGSANGENTTRVDITSPRGVEGRSESGGVEIPADAQLTGRVVEADSGTPVARAEVRIRSRSADARPSELVVTTDSEGRFSLPFRKSLVGTYTVQSAKTGFHLVKRELQSRHVDETGNASGFDLAMWTLPQCGRVFGKVVSSDGSDVSQARVRLRHKDDAHRRPELGHPFQIEAGLDEDAFQLAPVPPGRHRLVVTCEGYSNTEIASVSVEKGGVVPVGTLTLEPSSESAIESAILFGVVSKADGGPAKGARVTCNRQYVDEASVVVDEGGAFELRVPPGPRRIVLIELSGQPTYRFERGFEPGERVRFDYRAPGGTHFIGGIVVDGEKPVGGIEVTHSMRRDGPPGSTRGRVLLRDVTDDRGRFRLEGIHGETVSLFLAWERGAFRNLEVRDLATDRDDHRLRFPVPRPVSISGRVRSADGSPVESARIAPAFGPATQLANARATSDADGRFRVSVPLTNQSVVKLEVSLTGFRAASRRFLLREVDAEFAIVWNPVLFKESELGVLSGKVVDGQGKPLAAVRCDIESLDAPRHSRERWSAASDSEGRYESPPVSPGKVRVTYRHAEFVAGERDVHVVAGRTECEDMILERAVRRHRSVAFLDATGRPVAGAGYSITCRLVRSHKSGETGADGVVHLPNWPAASTTITVWLKGRFPRQQADVAIASDQEKLQLRMRRGSGVIVGRVLSPQGQPVVNEIVQFVEKPGPGLRIRTEFFTSQDGRVQVSDLPDSEYAVDVANHRGTRRNVRPSGEDITLRFPPK